MANGVILRSRDRHDASAVKGPAGRPAARAHATIENTLQEWKTVQERVLNAIVTVI